MLNDVALGRAVAKHNEDLRNEKTCRWFALCGNKAVALRTAPVGNVPVCERHAKFGNPKPTDIQPF